jgi:UDP-N-acetylenolpyruvoylglucosamine reductase
MRFADLTTFRVGGEIAKVVSGDSEEIILKTLLSDSDAYVVGGGSNILASDTPFNGTVLVMNTKGSELDYDACSGGMITVAAGVLWEKLAQLRFKILAHTGKSSLLWLLECELGIEVQRSNGLLPPINVLLVIAPLFSRENLIVM